MAKLNIRNRNLNQYDKNGKPKAPNWEYRFEAAKVGGKRKHISKAGYRTKRDAEIAGAKALAEYENSGKRFEPSDISFADYLDFWLENYVKLSCKYNTQLSYAQIIENHLKPALGGYKLRSLTPMTIQEYVNRKFASGLKKSHLRNIISVLTSALKYAVLPAQLLQSSPAEYITYPKLQAKRTEVNRTVISIEDFHRMLARFPEDNPFHYALLIGYYTGMRIGEVFGLTWEDIDFNAGVINVNKLVYKRSEATTQKTVQSRQKKSSAAWYFGDTKTLSSVRTIPIGSTLLRALKKYHAWQLQNQMLYEQHYTSLYQQEETDEKGNTIYRLIEAEKSIPLALPQADLIMRKENGQYLSTDSFKYAARVIHYELGIKFNYHSLRHTHATMLIEQGVSPKAVQARLGHENIETTLQTYVHNTPELAQAAVEAFEAVANK